MIEQPKYPQVEVQLSGLDGNALGVLGRMKQGFRDAGLNNVYGDFLVEATTGDYDHLLQTCMKWVTVK